MNIEKFLIITFDSTHLVMKIEKFLLEAGISVQIIPLPGELKSSCGFSIKAEIEDINKIILLFKDNNIEENIYSIYLCEKIGFKKTFSPFNF
ncbi:DUF3343 domain-containing protein [Cetobacterium sp.]|uniref:DUF3343 domain-containing protein n=1 Tax=Cetobacterium sp. TaxID=2071632 RepID=UPI003EE63A41